VEKSQSAQQLKLFWNVNSVQRWGYPTRLLSVMDVSKLLFNSVMMVGKESSKHDWKGLETLIVNCDYRGLPSSGTIDQLVERLDAVDEEVKTRKGLITDNDRRVKVQRQLRLARVVPFPWFDKFPAEVSDRIWELSLPGPRTLCLGRPNLST